MSYTVTVKMARPLTPLDNGKNSSVGHMWYSLDDGQGNLGNLGDPGKPHSFGFAPIKTGVSGDGWVNGTPEKTVYDDRHYLDTTFEVTFELTKEQYDAMMNFGEDPEEYGFSKYYNGLTNSCVDFTWAALNEAGMSVVPISPKEVLEMYREEKPFDGFLLPVDLRQKFALEQMKFLIELDKFFGETADLLNDRLMDALEGLNDAIANGTPFDPLFNYFDHFFGGGLDVNGIHLDFAKKATQGSIARMDPLAFDLGGFHGIDTTGKNNGVLFDHNADGVKNGTGWVREYDAWLVLDKDGNDSIDSGRELFGVDTIKRDGHFAQNGFDALADWDLNADGVIDAQDEIFTELRLWRDLNQDGISQSEELLTLSDLNIASINLQNKKENTNLDGTGNVQSATGSYTRTDGSTGLVGNLEVVADTFYRDFTTRIELTAQAKALPTLRGSGLVRDLNEAISLSPALGDWVARYAKETTREGQWDLLAGFLDKWAATSDMKSLKEQADDLGVSLTLRPTFLSCFSH